MQIPSIQLAVFGMPGGWEMIIVLVIALLIFGRKLPEVGRGLGKGLVEFKKGLKGVKDELDDVDREVDSAVNRKDDEPKQLDATDPDELADETKAGKSKTEA